MQTATCADSCFVQYIIIQALAGIRKQKHLAKGSKFEHHGRYKLLILVTISEVLIAGQAIW